MNGFSGFGESTSPIKYHEPGRFPGESRGAHLFGGKGKRKRRTKTSVVEKIGTGIFNIGDKISDTVTNVKKKIKVNKEIKRRTNNKRKNGNTGSSNSRTLPEIGSTKIPRN